MVKKQLGISPGRNCFPFYTWGTEAQSAISRDDTGSGFLLRSWDSGTFWRTASDWLMPNLYMVATAAFSLKSGSPCHQRCTDHHSPACLTVHKPLYVLCKAPDPLAWGKSLTFITPFSSQLWIPALPNRGQALFSRCKICPSFHHFMACLLCRIWVPSLTKPRSCWFWSPSTLLPVPK